MLTIVKRALKNATTIMALKPVKPANETPSVEGWLDSDRKHALENLTKSTFADGSVLSNFLEDQRETLVAKLYSFVDDVRGSKNSFLKCRAELGSVAIAFAGLKVLCLQPGEHIGAVLYASPFISGELRQCIGACAKYNQELEDYVCCNATVSEEEMITFATVRPAIYLYYMTGLNAVRRELESVTQFDWFQPFIRSMMIRQEDTYGRKIGLPVLLPPNIGALMHSTFFQAVVGGEEDPLAAWESHFSLDHRDVS